jgi:hypothetical protein
MLYTVGFNYLNSSIISLYRETNLVYSVTFPDLAENTLFPFGKFGGFVEAFFNGAEKAVMFV